jgi:hypothetical protein
MASAEPLNAKPLRAVASHQCLASRRRAMDQTEHDWADRIGKRISTVIVALLAAFLAYGFLNWIVFG